MTILAQDEILLSYIQSKAGLLEHNHKIVDILEGDLMKYVQASMMSEVSPQSYEAAEPRIAPLNFLVRIVDKLSKIYGQTPIRTLVGGNDRDQELFDLYQKSFQFNATMNISNEMFNAFKYNLNYPYLDIDMMPKLRVVPNSQFLVYSDDLVDPTRPTHVILPWGEDIITTYQMNKGVKEEQVIKVKKYKIYTNDSVYILDEKGNRSYTDEYPDGENIYGTLQFMYTNQSRLFLIPPPDSDTLRMTILLAKLISDLNYAVKFQTFSIVYGIDIDEKTDMKMAPNAFWRLKSDPSSDKKPELGQIKPQVDISAVIQLITTELSMWLNSKNIRPGSVSDISAENMVSGISKLVDEMDTSDERKKQTEIFKVAEENFWNNLFHKIHPVWVQKNMIHQDFKSLFSSNLKVEVNFHEQLPLLRRGQLVADLKTEVEAGFISRQSAIRKLNPDWDDKRFAEEMDLMTADFTIVDDSADDQNQDDENLDDENQDNQDNQDQDNQEDMNNG